MKKITAMLFTLIVAVAMTMPAFAAGQQTQGETPTTQGQTTPKKHKKAKKKKSSKKHHKGTSSTTTPPPQ
ncbi:MAG TPA: hypothetical protein VFZ27_08690 [Terriglobia bacterium]|nr:hypothetical protein [Terriglobia bacterium]